MEQRTLVVMAAMGLLNICFGLVDSIQVTQFKFNSGDFSPFSSYHYYTLSSKAPFFPGEATRKGATASQFGPSQAFSNNDDEYL